MLLLNIAATSGARVTIDTQHEEDPNTIKTCLCGSREKFVGTNHVDFIQNMPGDTYHNRKCDSVISWLSKWTSGGNKRRKGKSPLPTKWFDCAAEIRNYFGKSSDPNSKPWAHSC